MAIGELLKSYRKVSGFSVKETVQKLSERGIDVSEKTLYSWESGHRQPDADTFITLCLIYGVTSIPNAEKAPDSAKSESEAALMNRVQMLAKTFEDCGYIPESGDLTDDQLRFCMGLVDFLDTYFGN